MPLQSQTTIADPQLIQTSTADSHQNPWRYRSKTTRTNTDLHQNPTTPIHTETHEHQSTPKHTKTTYPHYHTVTKTMIKRRKEHGSQRQVWQRKGWGSQRDWWEEKVRRKRVRRKVGVGFWFVWEWVLGWWVAAGLGHGELWWHGGFGCGGAVMAWGRSCGWFLMGLGVKGKEWERRWEIELDIRE